jgi:guanylate kinase
MTLNDKKLLKIVKNLIRKMKIIIEKDNKFDREEINDELMKVCRELDDIYLTYVLEK